MREEEKERLVREHNERSGYDHDDSPVPSAVLQVFESVGDDLSFYRGVLTGQPEALAPCEGARPPRREQALFGCVVDRHGRIHVPFDEAMGLARAFSAVEPSTVLAGVESTEQDWSQEAVQPGKDYLVGLLNKYRASWATIRQVDGSRSAIHAGRLE